MINKKTALVIGLQTFLIVILFWMLVFYSKDEFEDFRTEQEEEIESLDRVTEKEGISIVSLSPAVQKNSGIITAKVTPMTYLGEIKSFGTIIPLEDLIAAKNTLLNLRTERAMAQANRQQHATQFNRLKALNADDKNVSDLAVQQAKAALSNDNAAIHRQTLAIDNLRASVKLQWGETLAKQALSQKSSAFFQDLLNRKKVLIQISLPFNAPNPTPNSVVMVTPLNGHEPIEATYVSVSTQADNNGAGKTFYYSAPANHLRSGMRVSVEASASKDKAINGVIIPSNAVVWYAGTPWAYFKEENNQFIRKPISADAEVDAGWFNESFDADNEVVVKGAQLLLSEEFKYLIKNENDD